MTADAGHREGFDRKVPLPPELKVAHIRKAIDYIEKETSELIEVYFERVARTRVLGGPRFFVRNCRRPHRRRSALRLLFNRIRDASARAKEKDSPAIATLRHGMR